MDIQETIEVIEKCKHCILIDEECQHTDDCNGCRYDVDDSDISEALIAAVDELKRMIPAVPVLVSYKSDLDEKLEFRCPDCNNKLHKYAKVNKFCNICGRAINWDYDEF